MSLWQWDELTDEDTLSGDPSRRAALFPYTGTPREAVRHMRRMSKLIPAQILSAQSRSAFGAEQP